MFNWMFGQLRKAIERSYIRGRAPNLNRLSRARKNIKNLALSPRDRLEVRVYHLTVNFLSWQSRYLIIIKIKIFKIYVITNNTESRGPTHLNMIEMAAPSSTDITESDHKEARFTKEVNLI